MKKVTSAAGIAATGTSYTWGANPAVASDSSSVAVLEKSKIAADIYLCDASVSTWKNSQNGRIIHLIGTAHISSSSAQLAGNVVREVRPDAVFVELDAKRVARAVPSAEKSPADASAVEANNSSPPSNDPSGTNAVKSNAVTASSMNAVEGNPQQDRLRKANPFDIKERVMRAGSAMVGDAIKGLYKKLETEGFNAGEEFVVAVREGLNVGSKIILGDRDVEVTLRRLTDALAQTDLKKLLAADSEMEKSMEQLLPKNVVDSSSSELTKDQFASYVETMKAKDNVKLLMTNLKQSAPELYRALVAERDEFMADGLDKLNQFQLIVAVMGIAHVDGVENVLRERGWTPVKLPCSINR